MKDIKREDKVKTQASIIQKLELRNKKCPANFLLISTADRKIDQLGQFKTRQNKVIDFLTDFLTRHVEFSKILSQTVFFQKNANSNKTSGGKRKGKLVRK